MIPVTMTTVIMTLVTMTTVTSQIYTLRDGSINSMAVDTVLGRLYVVLDFGDIKVLDLDGEQFYNFLHFILLEQYLLGYCCSKHRAKIR